MGILPPLDAHQAHAIASLREAYLRGVRAAVLVMPCGSGKTRTGTEFFDHSLRKGNRMLWLAHREELVDQAVKSLVELRGESHVGVIKAGRAENTTAPIQVASTQTLHKRPQSLPEGISIIASDECHHDKAQTREALFGRFPNRKFTLGLTATPERGDGQPLGIKAGGLYEHMVIGATVAELQQTMRYDDEGRCLGPILVPFRVVGPKRYQRELFEEPIAALFKYGRRADGRMRPAIFFASSLKASEELARAARARGIRAAHVDGETDEDVRSGIFKALKEGRLDLVTNVLVATEGTDIPNVEVVGVGRGCSAASTWIQMVMRGGRASPHTGKRGALLLDFCGHSHVHGLMEEERRYSLDGRAIDRVEKIPLRQCISCASVFKPAPKCPACGMVMGVERQATKVKKSEAVEITKDNITPIWRKRQIFDDLCRQARAGNWEPKAVGVRFKKKFGHWPQWPIPSKGAAA